MNKCHVCKHYVLQYSHFLKTYVAGCDLAKNKKGCKGSYEDARPKLQKARIK